jgi:hypothetical protein
LTSLVQSLLPSPSIKPVPCLHHRITIPQINLPFITIIQPETSLLSLPINYHHCTAKPSSTCKFKITDPLCLGRAPYPWLLSNSKFTTRNSKQAAPPFCAQAVHFPCCTVPSLNPPTPSRVLQRSSQALRRQEHNSSSPVQSPSRCNRRNLLARASSKPSHRATSLLPSLKNPEARTQALSASLSAQTSTNQAAATSVAKLSYSVPSRRPPKPRRSINPAAAIAAIDHSQHQLRLCAPVINHLELITAAQISSHGLPLSCSNGEK